MLFPLLFLTLLTPASADAEVVIAGKVVQVISGDRLWLEHPKKGKLGVQLQSVDAPELASKHCPAQTWANQAQRFLQQHVLNQQITGSCLPQLDADGFAHCRIYRGNHDINEAVIAQGYAWYDRRYAINLALQQKEQEARAEKIGIWSDRLLITAPWAYREKCEQR